MRRRITFFLVLIGAAACDDGPSEPDTLCTLESLPLSGAAAAPVVVDVVLEVQAQEIVVAATATDPQGDADLLDVQQSISVFPDSRCEGTPIVLADDLAGSGVEETFGTVVDVATNPALFSAIAAAQGWPVDLDFRDSGGNRTTGTVLARIVE